MSLPSVLIRLLKAKYPVKPSMEKRHTRSPMKWSVESLKSPAPMTSTPATAMPVAASSRRVGRIPLSR